MKNSLFILILVLTFSIAVIGQTGKPTKVTTTKPVTTQPATTDDGKRVTLKSDGTWQYETSVQPSADVPKTIVKSTLSIETGIVYKNGDVKPAARTRFILLDKPFNDILTAAGVKQISSLPLSNSYILALKIDGGSDGKYKDFLTKGTPALKEHTVTEITTDFSGKGIFENVSSGTFYLFGYTETARGQVIWSMPVILKPGSNSIILDQNNAEYAY